MQQRPAWAVTAAAALTETVAANRPLIGPLRLPSSVDRECGSGLFVCAGCNGTGAKFALEWGRQLAEDVKREPTVSAL